MSKIYSHFHFAAQEQLTFLVKTASYIEQAAVDFDEAVSIGCSDMVEYTSPCMASDYANFINPLWTANEVLIKELQDRLVQLKASQEILEKMRVLVNDNTIALCEPGQMLEAVQSSVVDSTTTWR